MPKICFVFVLIVMTLISCNKDNDSSYLSGKGLKGRWKMTAVMDKNSGELQPPPASDGQVFIEITGDSFSGRTMRNSISGGVLLVNKHDSITFGSYNATHVAENEWGGAFLTMLGACMLQSVYPCRPSVVSRKSPGRIEINTPLRYIITLEEF